MGHRPGTFKDHVHQAFVEAVENGKDCRATTQACAVVPTSPQAGVLSGVCRQVLG
jgi:hypothetical protein